MNTVSNVSFICFNAEIKDANGGKATVIVRIEEMDLTNEQLVFAREILSGAAEKLRAQLRL